jgi:hypothetical protein
MMSPCRQSLGLAKEKRWSIVDSNQLQHDVRRNSQLRKSLQSHVDPIRKHVSYVDKPGLGGSSHHSVKKNNLSDEHSVTSHTELSSSREEDPITITAALRKDYKPYEVTRKPRENSLVGQLSQVFQKK